MKKFSSVWIVLCLFLTLATAAIAQETTAALQGTIKDPTGALVPGATVTVTAPSLVGNKTVQTDSKGYYHFSNLPPDKYTLQVTMKGFDAIKRNGILLEVGHSPSIDVTLQVGTENTVIEVADQTPPIDVTSVTTQTNITQDVVNFVPRGTSFQSVIQFAPAASNEPLMGNTTTKGTGSVSAGNGSNGNSFGYSIAGGSDSENSYLVEGQETANLIGGYSHTNVPFDFIDQVQVKSNGIAAEYGGALGGVINVIMRKGSRNWHGSLFATYNASALNAGPNSYTRYDPLGSETATSYGYLDAASQSYKPLKDHTMDILPGFTFGGPLVPTDHFRDKLFFFVAFNPEIQRQERRINYGPASAGNATTGIVPYSTNTNSYYTTARVDAQVTDKVRVFGSWLYQLQKQYGQNLPFADSVQGFNYTSNTGFYNASVQSPVSSFAHSLGYTAPNVTVNTGVDWTVTPHIVATSRFGYYFENYHDFGFPTGGDVFVWETNGVGQSGLNGALPASLQHSTGYQTDAIANITKYNANKAMEISQDISWYKSTSWGTHNFKFGYQMNRNSNTVSQVYNEPQIQLYVGNGGAAAYSPETTTGNAFCASSGNISGNPKDCQGNYGYAILYDFGTGGSAISYNHSIYGQDSWTMGRGVTIDAGLRVEHEFLPGEIEGYSASIVPPDPINFGWKQKIAPRVGVSWDVFRDGRMKVFGSYGVFNDQMKLNLAISSFGGQYWNNCVYTLNTDTSGINVQYSSYNGGQRYCAGPNSSANAINQTIPAADKFIENFNERAATPTCATCNPYEEAVAPNLRPYQQHESTFGVDYQLTKTVSLEGRWDRRRLDHVIEDSAIYNPAVGETFVIVNPGQGVNSTFEGFCQFLYSTDPSGCVSPTGAYPPTNTIPAARSYDGVEFRLNKAVSHNWYAMLSYTYSHFRGNYTGLTSSDIADGGNGGRNAPNNSRAFDEPYFSWSSLGTSSSGLLPTDRPNKVKAYAYYQLKYLSRMSTNFGLFQYFYQGSPNTTYGDVGLSFNAFPVNLVGRGKWVDITQNKTTGAYTVSAPYTYRNPWYNQSDFQVEQAYKVREGQEINFQATFTNLLNQHAVTAVNEQVDTAYGGNEYITPGGYNITAGIPFYAAAQSAYNLQSSLNGTPINGQPSNSNGGPITLNSEYGKPLSYQLPRTIRLSIHYTF